MASSRAKMSLKYFELGKYYYSSDSLHSFDVEDTRDALD